MIIIISLAFGKTKTPLKLYAIFDFRCFLKRSSKGELTFFNVKSVRSKRKWRRDDFSSSRSKE